MVSTDRMEAMGTAGNVINSLADLVRPRLFASHSSSDSCVKKAKKHSTVALNGSETDQWEQPFELQRSGRTRIVLNLQNPDTVEIIAQEQTESGWQVIVGDCAITLTKAAFERLVVAAGFRW